MLERWAQEKLAEKSFTHNQGKEKYILHDGPPYANGHLHLGHAYNKILKDIVTKSQRMFGKHVPVTPGWDCHGLPIELKVTKKNPQIKNDRAQLKRACRAYAQKWIDVQREEFKQLGVLMDWDNPYLTMNFNYEASILRAFGEFVAQGYIERKNKTVPWCPSCETVLATAEIEYEDRKDPSIYVLFPLEAEASKKLFPDLQDKPVNFLVWTTTPWTLPLNRAVLLKPKSPYVVLETDEGYLIVGKQLADHICSMTEIVKKPVAEVSSEKFEGVQVQHPFVENLTVPVILDASVLLEDGTACVHSAPGCGPEDYNVAIKNNLEIFSPISSDGKYTEGIAPKELEGMPVADGQIWVLRKLKELGRLFHKTSIRHSYPHCWRCRGGLIFRATKQWFCDLSQNNLKEKTLKAADSIKTVPEKSINRLKATIGGRLEWVLSRQRIWGVPIPALLCTACEATHTSQELVENVATHVEKKGVEWWDGATIEELVGANFSCPSCKGTTWQKEQDILDVWFDAGVSHFAVLKQNKNLAFPANMYLEGSDQHRGWFQSSLLTSMVLEGEPCTKTIMTHGFTVDKKGKKMSKSLGNVISPQEMIDKLGTDGLRLWVSSLDSSGDAVVSDVLMKNVQEVFRKVRNTSRFLLSNLYDFDSEKDAIAFDQLRAIDRYALWQLVEINEAILQHYQNYDFTAIFHRLADYCAVDLSSLYLDIIKDRLYCDKADGNERRSAQTACWYILDTLTKLTAPILSFTAEQVSDHYQTDKKDSIHLQAFNDLRSVYNFFTTGEVPVAGADGLKTRGIDFRPWEEIQKIGSIVQYEEQWDVLKQIRSAILKAIEELREKGTIKHSLEARVTLHFDAHSNEALKLLEPFFAALQETGQSAESFFKEFVIVSQVVVAGSDNGLQRSAFEGMAIKVEVAQGDKCPRCWHWQQTDHEHKLCERCQKVLG